MQQAFGTVIIVVVILGVIFAIVSALGMGRLYDQIGKGALSLDRGGETEPTSQAEAAQVRDDEIRQLLEARNAVRIGRGKAPLDVEAELAALARPKLKVDPELYEEVR